MKITARNLRTSVLPLGDTTLKFDCSTNAKAFIEGLRQGDYIISIEKPKNARTLQQNRYLWELIGQIAIKENGNKAEDTNIYMQLIEVSGAKCEYLLGLPETEKALKQVFRVVKVVDSRVYNGKEMYMYKCHYGSSSFSKEEMATLIDKTIERAERDGIDTEPWEGYLYDL